MDYLDVLNASEKKQKDKDVLFYQDRRFRYEELYDYAGKFSNYLRQIGVMKGDRIGFYLTNVPEYVWLLLGTLKTGAVGVPINYRYKIREIKELVEESDCRIFIACQVADDYITQLRSLECLEEIFLIDKGDFIQEIEAQSPEVTILPVQSADEALIIFTSGSTGKPKGCRITYKYLGAAADQLISDLRLTYDDRVLNCLPFHHAAGTIDVSFNTLRSGGSIVLLPEWDVDEFLRSIEKHGVTWSLIVPTMVIDILNCESAGNYDYSSLRFLVNTGAVLKPQLSKEIENIFGAKVLEGYGLTEADVISVTPLEERERRIGAVGKVLEELDVKIISPKTGEELPVGGIGEICVKGDVVFPGYVSAELNQGIFDDEGFLFTGDIGRLDGDGYLYLEGRSKEMIKSGAEAIHPSEVEYVLFKHPKIREACVLGVPDERFGEAIGALILRNDDSLTEEEVVRFCVESDELANYKKPRYVVFTDAPLPRAPGLDKLDRRRAREECLERLDITIPK